MLYALSTAVTQERAKSRELYVVSYFNPAEVAKYAELPQEPFAIIVWEVVSAFQAAADRDGICAVYRHQLLLSNAEVVGDNCGRDKWHLTKKRQEIRPIHKSAADLEGEVLEASFQSQLVVLDLTLYCFSHPFGEQNTEALVIRVQ